MQVKLEYNRADESDWEMDVGGDLRGSVEREYDIGDEEGWYLKRSGDFFGRIDLKVINDFAIDESRDDRSDGELYLNQKLQRK